jgi:hypothetical protein
MPVARSATAARGARIKAGDRSRGPRRATAPASSPALGREAPDAAMEASGASIKAGDRLRGPRRAMPLRRDREAVDAGAVASGASIKAGNRLRGPRQAMPLRRDREAVDAGAVVSGAIIKPASRRESPYNGTAPTCRSGEAQGCAVLAPRDRIFPEDMEAWVQLTPACASETWAAGPNPRKHRRFPHTGNPHWRDPTVWLGISDTNFDGV